MKLSWTANKPRWIAKIATSAKALMGPREFGPKPPRGAASRALRRNWLCVCIALAVLLNLGMYYGLRWSYPTDEQTDFREEVSTLLSIQGYLIAVKPNDIIPSMDSIRDVVFGSKVVGAAVRQRCRDMLKDREKIDLDPILANTVEESLRRWDQAEKNQRRLQKGFIAGFLAISLGTPVLLFTLGLPAFAALCAKLEKRASDKRTARANARLAATGRVKSQLNRRRQEAAKVRNEDSTRAEM
jgi:hypothetical protein